MGFVLNTILQFDLYISQSVNALMSHNRIVDLFFSFFSLRGSSILIWVVIALFLIIFEERCNKRFIVSFVISILLALLITFAIKNVIRRPRPNYANLTNSTSLTKFCPTDFSFPSGHAATAFAAARIIAYYDKKRKWFYFLVAGFIGLSRIYLGCHYFLDVMGGGIIGYFISQLTIGLTAGKN